MKYYSPGASMHSDYAYICDCCEVNDGRATLIWEPLSGRKGHFALCYQCLKNLNAEYNKLPDPNIIITRLFIPESLRNRVFERDGYKCVKCGSADNLELDHIVPFSKGGRTEDKNLQTLCKTCNLKKSNRGV